MSSPHFFDKDSFDRWLSGAMPSFDQNTLTINVPKHWIIEGEDRLSYTTLFTLVECCREYQWEKLRDRIGDGAFPDSICKSISANFLRPILVHATISISWKVLQFDDRGYRLALTINDPVSAMLLANFELTLVFYDPIRGVSSAVAEQLRISLASLM